MISEGGTDIVVLGATGFTGKVVVKTLLLMSKELETSNLTWGITGRSKKKLEELLSDIGKLGGNISKIPVLECDVTDKVSLTRTAQSARVLVNCTGPNVLLGGLIVEACIGTGTHYVDISAELLHIMETYRKYNKLAEQSNVLVIPACGFAALPPVAGLIHLERHFKGVLTSVNCYAEFQIPKRAYFLYCNNALAHFGTWESYVQELHNNRQYRVLKKETFPELEPVPSDIKKSFFHRHKGRWWCPFPGPDNDVVEMSQTYLHEQKGKTKYHFQMFLTLPHFIFFLFLIPAFFIAYCACYFKIFMRLLIKFPRFFSLGLFSHDGPTEAMMEGTKYNYTLYGKGHDGSLSLKVSGSDPYAATAVSVICSAITILKEGALIPKGGVLQAGAAFRDTHIVDLMNNHGIKYEITAK